MGSLRMLVGAVGFAAAACSATSLPPNAYVGKVVLVGVVLVDSHGTVKNRVQAHGTIKAIEAEAGVVLSLAGSGSQFLLPPVLQSLHPIPPGKYRELSTGEVITNPDFATVWEAEYDDGLHADTVDWSRGMTWTRVVEFRFPGDNWVNESDR